MGLTHDQLRALTEYIEAVVADRVGSATHQPPPRENLEAAYEDLLISFSDEKSP